MKAARLFLLLVLCTTVNAQQLPKLREKPTPRFDHNSACAPAGLTSSNRNDPDLNKAKNRIDPAKRYFPVDFDVIKTLPVPEGVTKTKRSRWLQETRNAVADSEGIPIQLEGFLALTERSGTFVGGVKMGSELCNCQETGDFVDHHLWIVKRVGDLKAKSIVIEMTPRVRQKFPGWTIKNLNYIGVRRLPVRVSGWLMLDQEHVGNIKQGHRANVWAIHPIMKFEYKEGGRWKDLAFGLS